MSLWCFQAYFSVPSVARRRCYSVLYFGNTECSYFWFIWCSPWAGYHTWFNSILLSIDRQEFFSSTNIFSYIWSLDIRVSFWSWQCWCLVLYCFWLAMVSFEFLCFYGSSDSLQFLSCFFSPVSDWDCNND